MSKIKKALRLIEEYKEFFTDNFLANDDFQVWLAKKPKMTFYEFQLCIWQQNADNSKLYFLLKNSPKLLSIILSKTVKAEIRDWYSTNALARSERAERLQNNLITKLDNICEKYKAHLHKTIDQTIKKIEPKPVVTDFKSLHNSFNPHTSMNSPYHVSVLINELSSHPENKSEPLAEAAQEQYRAKAILAKYKVVVQLQHTLKGEETAKQKLSIFNQIFHAPKNKTILYQANDPLGIRFLKAIGHLLTFGLVSKFSKGTFKFWETKSHTFSHELHDHLLTFNQPKLGLC